MNNLKRGFTLAEVLITLGVIGVVAAMTMPVLITKYQKQVTVTQLKKAYSEISQAIQRAEADYGTLDQWHIPASDFNNVYSEQGKYFGEHYLFPYIKTVEKCIPSSSKCWADGVKNINDYEVTTYLTNGVYPECISFITSSGYSVYYWLHGIGTGAFVWIDINGPKKGPNKIGKDIFTLGITWGEYGGGVFPYGVKKTKEELLTNCKKTNSTTWQAGMDCTGLIAVDGWKISDDYPW